MATTNINLKQRKFLLMLPVLVLPFIALLFWAMGGGRQKSLAAVPTGGLNMELPVAKLKSDSAENKLSVYQQAEKDSLKFKQAQKDDPYYKQDSSNQGNTGSSFPIVETGMIPKNTFGSGAAFSDRSLNTSSATLHLNEQRINEKLAALTSQINHPEKETVGNFREAGMDDSSWTQLRKKELNTSETNGMDPQMEQLSSMLDKIQEIQNPALVRQKLQLQSQKNRGQVFAVAAVRKEIPIGSLGEKDNNTTSAGNGFYSIDNEELPDAQNAIEAVVHESQTVVNGSTIKLRLVNNVFINGVLLPKDNFIYGEVALNGDRLNIKINSIRYQQSIFPVALSVYDIDGIAGIYIPGAITRDVAKESADQSIQNLGFTSYSPSLGAQAATAGISAAKSLFSHKVRLVKVTVKAGYHVLLRDEKQQQAN
ncbi:MAG TPA: conjugative transposon protein TraM [Mucilaginibacter sp.]|nr:conjugative transposon protein TraM [Mucilaginibacter sp.]